MRRTKGMTSTHGYSREAAEPFAIRTLKEQFAAYPPQAQERIRAEVLSKLRDEQRHHEFAARVANDENKRPGSELARMAREVYGVWIED